MCTGNEGVTRRIFLISLAVWIMANAVVIWLFLDQMARRFDWVGEPVTRQERALLVCGALLIIWLSMFPPLRWMTRRRLERRARPGWWASIPGALGLAGIALFVYWAIAGWFWEVNVFTYFVNAIGVEATAIAFVALPLSALLLAAALIIECLRPDRAVDLPGVFH